jgi:ligand-binding SRPBCC domain-containing protein
MSPHHLHSIQKIPIPLQQAWDFFSRPQNLIEITPSSFGLKIITNPLPEKAYKGEMIEYSVSPLLRIPLHWITLITEVREPEFFVDESTKGPYKVWKHKHYFKAIDGGVEMRDHVEYINPMGFVGRLSNGLFVQRRLRELFEYRFNRIETLFGKWEGQNIEIKIA